MRNHILKHPHKSERRPQDFLLTIRMGSLHRKIVWNDQEEMLLDHPQGWVIARIGADVCIYDNSDPDIDRRTRQMFVITNPDTAKVKLELPPSFNQSRSRAVTLSVEHLDPIQPPYKQIIYDAPGQALVPRQLMMYQGVRYFLLKYRPVGNKLTTKSGAREVFTYEATRSGYSITPRVADLQVKYLGKKENLHLGIPHIMNEKEFYASSFIRGINWWRFRSVITPDALPPLVDEESETDAREASRVSFAYISVIASLLLLFCAAIAYNHFNPPEPKLIATKVELKTPKVIPHKEIAKEIPKPKPTPTPIVKKEKPKPKQEVVKEKPKKPEKKVVEKKPPKPVKKVVKKAPPTPKPKAVAKAPPKPTKAPEKVTPKKVAKAEAPPMPKKDNLPPPVKKSLQPINEPKAGVVAKESKAPPAQVDESAQLAKSLSFLSTGAKSPKVGGLAKYEKSNKKEFMSAPSLGGSTKDSNNTLDNISSASTDTSIKTRSSRSIATDAGFDAPKGKGLNDVQGKVSLTQLYSGGSMEGFEEGTSLALSGSGSLSESDIEKALSKFLAKFQFCYEKALLTDSSLAGNIRLQWDISTSGRVAGSKVINSQMKNAGLHSCIQKVLKDIPFPKPKGGTVTAKKTFSFKSSTL